MAAPAGPRLPVRIPVPLHVGEPAHGYPWRWTVVPWIAGRHAAPARRRRRGRWPATWPPSCAPCTRWIRPAVRSSHRGRADRPCATPTTVCARRWPDWPSMTTGSTWPRPGRPGRPASAAAEWDRRSGLDPRRPAAGQPDPRRRPAGRGHRLRGPRDRRSGARCGSGACGPSPARPGLAYRAAVGYDDATWRRACGWALAPSLTGVDYYRHTFPRMAEHGRRMVRAVIAELL